MIRLKRATATALLIATGLALALVVTISVRKLMWEIDPPERGIEGTQLFSTPVDVECIDRTLRQHFGDIYRFVGSAGSLPEGVEEDTFNYYNSPSSDAWVLLGVAELPEGTRVTQMFIGHGHKLPQSEFPPAIAAMRSATEAMRVACRVDLTHMRMKEIGQRVDAIH